jgi:4-amino-4-deoxy-L-arabinose transferase-like glycosyltransferase
LGLNRKLSGGRWTRVGGIASVVLVGVYALQVETPLRLNTDSVVYLSIARSLSTGHGLPAHADFPPGLPALYAVLDLAGIGRSWAIVALNVAFLALAVATTILIYRRALGIGREASVFLACGLLLSYVLVKHAALVVSDVPFLGVSSAALALFTVAAHERSGRRFVALALGLGLAVAATTIRTAGIALAPAALVAALEAARAGVPLRGWLRTRGAAIVLACCALAGAFSALALSSSRYFANASVGYGQTTLRSELAGHLRNVGEIGANIPETRLPHVVHPLLVPVGLVVITVLCVGLWRGRRRAEPAQAFALAYLVLVFVWPYTDARFWIPLIPLAIGYAYVAVRPILRHRAAVVLAGAYVAVFAVLGLAALAYDTRLSYSGARFPDLYGSDAAGVTLQPTYRVAFGEAQPGDETLVNPRALAVLRHWEARARPRSH